MPYKDHFIPSLDYSEYEYFRVPRSKYSEYVGVQNKILSNARKKKVIPETELNKLFGMLYKVSEAEFKWYIGDVMDHAEKVIAYFESNSTKYIFHDKHIALGEKCIKVDKNGKMKSGRMVEEYDDGFQNAIITAIQHAISWDKNKRRPLVEQKTREWIKERHQCIAVLLIEFLKYRKEHLGNKNKIASDYETYPLYKFAVVSAYIAHKFFGLFEKKLTYSQNDYFYKSRGAIKIVKSTHPELLKGLKTR